MIKRGKKYKQATSLIEKNKVYSAKEACELIKKTSTTKFDASVDVAFNLNIDTRYAEQQIRGAVVLPNGTGKTKTVLAITNKVEEAKTAGADFVGGKEMIEKIQKENWFGFDVCIATPDMMAKIGRIARVLGPKGLMPNPKSGTVTMDIAKAVEEVKAGKVEYRVDKTSICHVPLGKASFDAEKLEENFRTLMEAVIKAKPAAAKGQYLKSIAISSTMGPGIKVNTTKF